MFCIAVRKLERQKRRLDRGIFVKHKGDNFTYMQNEFRVVMAAVEELKKLYGADLKIEVVKSGNNSAGEIMRSFIDVRKPTKDLVPIALVCS
jgi:hypothetical protein